MSQVYNIKHYDDAIKTMNTLYNEVINNAYTDRKNMVKKLEEHESIVEKWKLPNCQGYYVWSFLVCLENYVWANNIEDLKEAEMYYDSVKTSYKHYKNNTWKNVECIQIDGDIYEAVRK